MFRPGTKTGRSYPADWKISLSVSNLETVKLASASWMGAKEVKAVFSALGYPEVDVRFVGGCVRDAILGRPIKDVDLATPDLPDTVTEKLTTAGLKAVPTGLDHGTVTAVSGRRGFQVTTLRRDTACDGRHAAVEFTTDWVEDASRRDFTMNAMSARPDGTLFDTFGGADDARAGVIRFVGNPRDRIQEDYLRILRYFRFLAHYGRQEPDPVVLTACHDLRAGLDNLSADRVRDELIKLLGAADPAVAVNAMVKSNIFSTVLPEAVDSPRLAHLIQLERDVGVVSVEGSWLSRFVCLLRPDLDQVDRAAKRLKFSNKDSRLIAALSRLSEEAKNALDQTQRHRFLYAAQDYPAGDAVLIAWARDLEEKAQDWKALYEAAQSWAPVVFPLSGGDIQTLGVPQGPQIGQLLARLEEDWIEGGLVATKDDLHRRLNSYLSKS